MNELILEFSKMDFYPFWVSFKLSLITTLILFCICLPFSWWLSQTKSKTKPFLESIVTLPLVLPPTVLGFYCLVILSPRSTFGAFMLENFDIRLAFHFSGIVIASCIYSLPFMTQPLQSGFEALDKNMLEASYISGKSKLYTIFKVALPNMRPSLLTALVITFAHTMGEFGVILLVGGGREDTKVASVAIYDALELSNFAQAHIYSACMLIFSFTVLITVYYFNGKRKVLKGFS